MGKFHQSRNPAGLVSNNSAPSYLARRKARNKCIPATLRISDDGKLELVER